MAIKIMNKEKVSKFFNPLWIIVILLIVMNILLWSISQRIGHDFIFESEGAKETIKPTGLYRAIYGSKPEMPYYDNEFEKIIDRLDWINDKLGDIEWNTR